MNGLRNRINDFSWRIEEQQADLVIEGEEISAAPDLVSPLQQSSRRRRRSGLQGGPPSEANPACAAMTPRPASCTWTCLTSMLTPHSLLPTLQLPVPTLEQGGPRSWGWFHLMCAALSPLSLPRPAKLTLPFPLLPPLLLLLLFLFFQGILGGGSLWN